jgi:hypothetical protein
MRGFLCRLRACGWLLLSAAWAERRTRSALMHGEHFVLAGGGGYDFLAAVGQSRREEASSDAAAVRRVRLGGGMARDALRMVAMQPLLWAGALALALSYAQQPLPATVSWPPWPLHAGAHIWSFGESVSTCMVRLCCGMLAGGGFERCAGGRSCAAHLAVHWVAPHSAPTEGSAGWHVHPPPNSLT